MADTIILDTIHIVSTPGVLGGKPRIEGTRMSVLQIVAYRDIQGWPLEEIAEAFNLTLAQIHVALAYYYDHRAAIDQAIREESEWVEQIETERREFARTDDVLNAVMTPAAAAHEFGITDRTVRDAIEQGKIDAIKSAGSWLIRRADAEARWGKRRKP
jgi:excisionase family DNA binding protein